MGMAMAIDATPSETARGLLEVVEREAIDGAPERTPHRRRFRRAERTKVKKKMKVRGFLGI